MPIGAATVREWWPIAYVRETMPPLPHGRGSVPGAVSSLYEIELAVWDPSSPSR